MPPHPRLAVEYMKGSGKISRIGTLVLTIMTPLVPARYNENFKSFLSRPFHPFSVKTCFQVMVKIRPKRNDLKLSKATWDPKPLRQFAQFALAHLSHMVAEWTIFRLGVHRLSFQVWSNYLVCPTHQNLGPIGLRVSGKRSNLLLTIPRNLGDLPLNRK